MLEALGWLGGCPLLPEAEVEEEEELISEGLTPQTLGVKAKVVKLLDVLCIRGSHQKVPQG